MKTTRHAELYLLATTGMVALLLATACTQQTPEERIAGLRSGYTAEITGSFIERVPMVPEAEETAAVAGEAGEEAATDAAAADDEAATEDDEESAEGEVYVEPVPTRQDAVLDFLVRNTNDERLPGLTLDVTMVDAEKNPKEHWLVWVDTSQIGRGPGTQVSHVLKDVSYEEGDGFIVEVRSPIPPNERADYREFQTP